MLSKLEVDILSYLFVNGLNSQMNSKTIRSLSKLIDINYFTLRNIINRLCLAGMVYPGYKEKNANSYYISSRGIEVIEKEQKEANVK